MWINPDSPISICVIFKIIQIPMQHIYQENQKDSLMSMEISILLDMVLEHIYFVI